MNPPTVIALLLAAAAGITLWVVLIRWRRERRQHLEQRATWQGLMDEELQQARVERDLLLNALNDAFLLIDGNSRIHFANQAAHKLCNSRSLAKRSVREAFIDPRLAGILTRVLESGKAARKRITLPSQTPSPHRHETRGISAWIVDAARLPATGGFPPLTRVIIHDITAEHQTEQIRKDFVANASHELRTPMSIIHGYLENLLDEDMLGEDMLGDRETCRHHLTIMRKHSQRMSRIIEDMLLISRLESGEQNPLNIEPFPIKECIQDILERLESLIRIQQAEVDIKIEDDSATILGDRFYWTQALFNLVENALKQNPRPGLKLEIGHRIDGGQHRLWVSDNGIGIPGADLPFIFRRFYRVDKHHNQSDIKGTGLGLSIVKRAIEAHHGQITVHSAPGEETTFLITLPLPDAIADDAEADDDCE